MSPSTRKRVALLGKVPPDVQEALAVDFDLVDAKGLRGLDEAGRLAITHGLTSAMSGVDDGMLDGFSSLKVIASTGAGMDRFDLDALAARGIALHSTPQVMTEDTAECAVGLLFALLRNIAPNDGFVRSGKWASARAPLGARLSGRRVGIVGLGRVGARVAAKLDALGCGIFYTGTGRKDVSWTYRPDVVSLAASVDVLVLTCAGGAATKGIVDAEVLRQLGPEGFLVNVSRGSVVDESALIAALQSGRIAGAALDVFENEPTPDPRFFDLANCLLSPHAAVYTAENRRDLIAKIKRLLSMQPDIRTQGGDHADH